MIVGGGACGLMCAIQAGLRGKQTLVLERNDHPGAKIRISGGGRCNYTNLNTDVDNFVSVDPSFASHALSSWTVKDTVGFFEHQGIVGKEKTLGQLFPISNNAKDVVSVLTRLMQRYGQQLQTGSNVLSVDKRMDGQFEVTYESSGVRHRMITPKVVFASGGLPVAKLGASDFAIRIARRFGLEIVPTAPALVPLTITGKDAEWFAALSGNSVFCRVSNERIRFEENILFTHWGVSGPAILQISSYWKPGESIVLNLLPTHSLEQLIQTERAAG